MELEHDDFLLDYDASRVSIAELLKACTSAGFPASVVDAPSELARKKGNEDVELPDFYMEALARAKTEQKPIVLKFCAAWCVPCQRMDKETLLDARVASLLENCILVKADADEHEALIVKYGVIGLPDVRFLSPDGIETKRLVDFQDADSFATELSKLVPDAD